MMTPAHPRDALPRRNGAIRTFVAEAHEKAVAAEKETQAAAEREVVPLLPRRMLSARAVKENLAPWG